MITRKYSYTFLKHSNFQGSTVFLFTWCFSFYCSCVLICLLSCLYCKKKKNASIISSRGSQNNSHRSYIIIHVLVHMNVLYSLSHRRPCQKKKKAGFCLTVVADSPQSSGDTMQLCPLCPKAAQKHMMRQRRRGRQQSCEFVLIRVCLTFDSLTRTVFAVTSNSADCIYPSSPPATSSSSSSRFHYMLIAVCSGEK